jgi:N-acetylglutamate synthase-like GNAT family acetyltransferase
MTCEIVPAERKHFVELLGAIPLHRVKGYAGIANGKVVGVGGVYYFPDGTIAASLALSESARRFPKTLLKVAKQVMKDARETGVKELVALADLSIPRAREFLLHLGFLPEFIEADGKQVEVFKWHSTPSR